MLIPAAVQTTHFPAARVELQRNPTMRPRQPLSTPLAAVVLVLAVFAELASLHDHSSRSGNRVSRRTPPGPNPNHKPPAPNLAEGEEEHEKGDKEEEEE